MTVKIASIVIVVLFYFALFFVLFCSVSLFLSFFMPLNYSASARVHTITCIVCEYGPNWFIADYRKKNREK